MLWSEFAARFSSGTPYEWCHVRGEIEEFVEELKACNASEAWDEFGDAVMTLQLWLYWVLPVDLPMVAPKHTFKKYACRIGRWRGIFEKEHLEFHHVYLRCGGNPDRPHKRARVLGFAREEQ